MCSHGLQLDLLLVARALWVIEKRKVEKNLDVTQPNSTDGLICQPSKAQRVTRVLGGELRDSVLGGCTVGPDNPDIRSPTGQQAAAQ